MKYVGDMLLYKNARLCRFPYLPVFGVVYYSLHLAKLRKKLHILHIVCTRMYVCMYKGRAIKSSPCTATFNDL
jgi:hypothetical protein